MSDSNSDSWLLVKLTRWENGHSTSSTPLPISIDAGGNNYELENIYKTVWDHFTGLERDISRAHDRKNLPAGAGPRASDGIEGLRVNWVGFGSEMWSTEETYITQNNLAGILQRLAKTPSAVVHCIIKDSKLGDIEWNPNSN